MSSIQMKTIEEHTREKRLYKRSKGNSPVKGLSGPEGSRKLRFPDYLTTAQDGGKVVSLTVPLPPGNAPGTHFC
jgi:hypothetical protein